VAAAANAPWKGSAFDGAENIYNDAAGNTYLDDQRISLLDAVVNSKNCSLNFVQKTLNYTQLISAPGAHVIRLCPPSPLKLNTTLAKVNVTMATGSGNVSRTLLISQDENDVRIMTNRGEIFTGYYVVPDQNGCLKLLFDPSVITSMSIANVYYGTATFIPNEVQPTCATANKTYTIPANNCIETHTGEYAFVLDAGKSGTKFTINRSDLPSNEFQRKYTAMVWVHNTSPLQTTLVMNTTTSSKTVNMSSPYITAGNWKLLRIDIDAPSSSDNKIEVYLQNNSTNGIAVYDDFRVQPMTASLEATVYDHKFGRVSARLNKDNFATFYNYDARGRLTEVKSEIQNLGPTVIKKYLYNDQKVN
jgi:YD repeat-containing protein